MLEGIHRSCFMPKNKLTSTASLVSLSGDNPEPSALCLCRVKQRNGLPCVSASKESACNEGDLGSIPGLGRSPGKGKVVSSSLLPHGLYSPWNSPGQNAGVGSRSLLHGIFPTQESNPGLPHCRQILYQLSHQGRPGPLITCMRRHSVP